MLIVLRRIKSEAEIEMIRHAVGVWSGLRPWDSERKLRDGEIVHVDLYGSVKGYYTDFARSTVVGGKTGQSRRLCRRSSR